MRIVILEVREGHSEENVVSLRKRYPLAEIEVLNVGRHIPDVTGIPTDDYFEFLQSVPDVVDNGVVDILSQVILKNIKWTDFILVPLAVVGREAVLAYTLSWIISYVENPGLRGTIYYVDKSKPDENLIAQFEELFEFEKLVTEDGDILYLDVQPHSKSFFTKLTKEEQ